MTSEDRRKITKQIIENLDNSTSTTAYNGSIDNIKSKIEEDTVNRKEFISVNDKIKSYLDNLNNTSGYIIENSNFPIEETIYFQDNNNTISADDNIELWKGAQLTKDNIFYVPNVSNSEKLILDVINSTDSDGTTNIEPIVPSNYSSTTFSHIDAYNEETVMNLLEWSRAAYENGYGLFSVDVSIEPQEYTTNSNGIHYFTSISNNDPGYFHVGDTIYFKNSTKTWVGEVKSLFSLFSDDFYNFYVEIIEKTPASLTEAITFSEKIINNSELSKTLFSDLILYWKSLLENSYTLINSFEFLSTNDENELSSITSTLEIVNSWLGLSLSDKFLPENLNTLSNYYSVRRTAISNRTSYLKDGTIITNLINDRVEIIKLRLRKRSGTLNSIHREIVALNTSSDKTNTDGASYSYFKNKFVVKRLIEDCTDTKIIYTNDSTDLQENDMVFVISDDSELKEIKTYIKSITSYKKTKKTETSVNPEVIVVSKITLANSISSSFLYSDYVRIAKPLS